MMYSENKCIELEKKFNDLENKYITLENKTNDLEIFIMFTISMYTIYYILYYFFINYNIMDVIYIILFLFCNYCFNLNYNKRTDINYIFNLL